VIRFVPPLELAAGSLLIATPLLDVLVDATSSTCALGIRFFRRWHTQEGTDDAPSLAIQIL